MFQSIQQKNLEKLFNPKSIAIVGATSMPGKVGNVITKNILNLGYAGKVFLVNPTHREIFGKVCFSSLKEIEKEVDLAIIVIPARFVEEEIRQNADKVKNFVIISAGFSEIGWEGKMREENLKKIIEEKKINILGPNCLGFIVPELKLNASFAGGLPKPGKIAFISQSGALAVAFLDISAKEEINFSKVISIGNKMQISETELLEYLGEDEKTEIIGMYLENIKDGKKFIKIAQKYASKKPIIILKAGHSEKTQKAIASHTGALAGDDEIISVALEKTGILQANNLEEFFSLLKIINQPSLIPKGKTVIITNAGGVGVLTADAFSGKNIQLANINEKTKESLRSFLPIESSLENPIDLLGDAKEDRYRKALEIISADDEAGSFLCVLTPQDQTPVEKIAQEIINFKKRNIAFVASIFVGGKKVEKAIQNLNKSGICNFSFPEIAVKTLETYWRWGEFKSKNTKSKNQFINQKRQKKIQEIVAKAQKESRSVLYFSEASKIMEMYNLIPASYQEFFPEKNLSEFEITQKKSSKFSLKFPVVLKVDDQNFLHKTEKGGVVLGIENEIQLKKNLKLMQKKFPGTRLIAQSMSGKAAEIIVGIKRDVSFGPIVVYGLGGIYTEFLKMVDYLIPPFTVWEAQEHIKKSKLSFLFQKTRGQKEYNIEELAKIVFGVSNLAMEIPQIKEFDINPVFMYNDEKDALLADIKIII